MGAGRRTQTVNVDTGYGVTGRARGESRAPPLAPPPPPRGLSGIELGGVIFGCTNHTMEECFSGALFGLPRPHISYVQNIQEGLPLFLFNYTTKLLHGIFEAAGDGDENINPFAWSRTGGGKLFPAQVPVRIRKYRNPVPESVFRRVIAQNYYTKWHFQFELDHVQTRDLCAVFEAGGKCVVPYFFGISLEKEASSSRAGKMAVTDHNLDHGWTNDHTTISQDERGNPARSFQDDGWITHGKSSEEGEWAKPVDLSQDDGWTIPSKSSQECDWGNSGRLSQDGGWTNRASFSQDAGWKRPGKSSQADGWTKPGKSFQDAEWTSSGKFSQDGGWKKAGNSFQDVGWANPGTTFRDDGELTDTGTSFQENGWANPNPNAESQDGGWTDSGRFFQNNEWKDPRSSQQGGWNKFSRFSQAGELTNAVKSSRDSGWANSRNTSNFGKSSHDSGWTKSRNSFQDDERTQDKGFAGDDNWAHHRASLEEDEGKNSEASSQDNGWIKPRKSASSYGRSSSDPISPSHEGLYKVSNDQGESAWQENVKWSSKPENSAETSELPSGVCKGQNGLQDSKMENGWQVLSDPSSTLGITQEDQGGSIWGKSSDCVWEPEVSVQKSETESGVCDEGPKCLEDLKVKEWQLSLDTPSNLGNLQEKFIEKDSLLCEKNCSLMTNSLIVDSNKSQTSEIADDMHSHCLSGDSVKDIGQARWNVTSCENAEPNVSVNFATDYLATESNELSKEDKGIVDDAEKGITTTEDAQLSKDDKGIVDDAEKGITTTEDPQLSKEDKGIMDDAKKGITTTEDPQLSKEDKGIMDDAEKGITTTEDAQLSKEDKGIVDDAEKDITTTEDARDNVTATAKKEKQVEWGPEDDMEPKQLESKQLALKEDMDNLLLALQPIDSIAASGVYKNVELCAEVLSETRHLHKEMRNLKQEASSLVQEIYELKQLQSERVALQKAHLSIVADVQILKLEFRNLQFQLKRACNSS